MSFMFADSNDKKAIFFIALYCLIYFSLRIFQNGSLEGDEIKQLLEARDFVMGDGMQAPLYLWILYPINKIFGLHPEALLILRYSLLFSFYYIFYLCMKKLVKPNYAFIAMVSLVFFPVYSFTMSVHYTHTLLVSVLSVASFLVYLNLMAKPKLLNYLLLGLLFGLGILAKYNFVFLPAVLVLATLTDANSRKVLLDLRTIAAIAVTLLVVAPHGLYLLGGETASVSHAMERGGSGDLNLLDLGRVIHMILNYSFQSLIYLGVFLVFFANKLIYRKEFKLCYYLSFYALTLPFLVVVLAKLKHFTVGWLAPIYFLLPFTLFALIDFSKVSKKVWNLFLAAAVLLTVIFLSIKVMVYFAPEIRGKKHQVHIPAQVLAQQLNEKLGDKLKSKDLTVIYYKGRLLKNLLPFMNKEAAVYSLEDFKVIKEQVAKPILVVFDSSEYGAKAQKKIQKVIPEIDIFDFVSANYNYSDRNYELGYSYLGD